MAEAESFARRVSGPHEAHPLPRLKYIAEARQLTDAGKMASGVLFSRYKRRRGQMQAHPSHIRDEQYRFLSRSSSS